MSEVLMSIQAERERASQVIAELYQNSFFQQYWRAIGRFIGRGKPASLWVSAAVVMSVNLLLGVTVSALLAETQFTTLNAILLSAELVTWTYVVIILTMNINGRLVEFLKRRITESLQHEQHIHELLLWTNQWIGRRLPQLLFSLGFGITIAPLAFYTLYLTTRFSFGLILLYFINFFHIGIMIYTALSFIAFMWKLKNWHLILYTDDPASSPILLQLSKEIRNYILFMALAIAILLFIVGSAVAFNIKIALLSLVAWIPILALFILGNQAFSQQIVRVKYERLEKLQSEIMKLSNAEKMDTDTIAQIKNLSDYHDRVKSSRNSLYSPASFVNLIGSLALPVLSVTLSTIHVWQRISGTP